jgi:hypothetical protein
MRLLEAGHCPPKDINTDGQIYHKDFLVAERTVLRGFSYEFECPYVSLSTDSQLKRFDVESGKIDVSSSSAARSLTIGAQGQGSMANRSRSFVGTA